VYAGTKLVVAQVYARGVLIYDPVIACETHSANLCGDGIMPVGGARAGAGRPKGTLAKVTSKAREAAMETGLLPHEWLLKVSRGEPIKQKRWVVKYNKQGVEVSRDLVEEDVYADFPTRIDAAKAASPFYAPKLAVQTVSVTANSDIVSETLKSIAEKLPV
jgi:hypothetical protein